MTINSHSLSDMPFPQLKMKKKIRISIRMNFKNKLDNIDLLPTHPKDEQKNNVNVSKESKTLVKCQ